MATLADSFLQDLEDLEDEIPEATAMESDDSDDKIVDAICAYELSQTNALAIVTNLAQQEHFNDILKKVRNLTELDDRRKNDDEKSLLIEKDSADTTVAKSTASAVADDEEYELIADCNTSVGTIDTEIMNIHKFIKDIYSKKLPELEQIVYSPLEYISIVKRVRNETDLTQIDLSDLLPNTVIMAVTVAASMTTGSPLPSVELAKVLGAAEEAFQLAECRQEILEYLESRMSMMAPNITAILGSSLTARLLTKAGGLQTLARMPAQNIMLIGAVKKASFGFSTANTGKSSVGLIYQSDIVMGTPPAFRARAVKLIAGKCSLAARVDSFNECPNGEVGQALREKIVQSILKAQEAPPAPLKKALVLHDEKAKSKRGGRKFRRMKEKYGMSELRKQAERLKFGPDAEEEVGLTGKGLGMLNKSTGLGKLRLEQKKQQKIQMPKKSRHVKSGLSAPKASSGATGGMSSSLIFTPVQGLELHNPDAERQKSQKPVDKFFGSSNFIRVERDKADGESSQ